MVLWRFLTKNIRFCLMCMYLTAWYMEKIDQIMIITIINYDNDDNVDF